MTAERATQFWHQAEYATSRADKARSDEMRRAWLIVARDWSNMARREDEKLALQKLMYVAQALPMAPEGFEEECAHAEPSRAEPAAAR